MAEIGVMKKLTIGGSTYTIPEYNLPIASASTLGGVKIGTGLSINSTTGVLSATGLDYDEADPIFTASAAYGITSSDISNWNSKTSNTGTITKIQTSAGAHSTVNVSSGNVSFNVPTKTSHLTNDSGYLTSADIASVLKYKGTKASYSALPSTGNTTGDVWHLTDTGAEYAWDGSTWQELGTAVDLSGYATKATTLAGYGITDAKIQNGVITLGSNTITPLTSYTETDPVFAASAAAGITSTDISNWNAKVSDDKTWGGVTFGKGATYNSADQYIPFLDSTTDTNSGLLVLTTTPAYGRIPKYDTDGYLISITPTATDNSTKVATTAFVKSAIPTNISAFTNDSGYLTSHQDISGKVNKSGDTMSGNLTFSDDGEGIIFTYETNTSQLGSIGNDGTVPIIGFNKDTIFRRVATPRIDNDAANKKYVDDAVGGITDTNTTYTLTNALSSHKFTWTLTAGGSGSGSTTTTAELVAGTGITLTDDTANKRITIASSVTVPTITLNGSSTTSPSFYAPTGAGTSGQYLKSSGSGAPTWTDFPTIPSITLNGSSLTSPSFYAPTSAGTNGYVLKSNGSGAPTWASAVLTDEKLALAEVDSNATYYPVVGTGTSAVTRQYDTTGFKYQAYSGTTTADGFAQITLGNSTASGTTGNKEGVIKIYGSGNGCAYIYATPNSYAHDWKFYLPLGEGATTTKFNLVAANSYGASQGTAIRPVYISQGGLVSLCSTYAGGTAVTLNGTSKSASTASFYAPTSAGSNGNYLKSNGSGEPSWEAFPTIPAAKSLTFAMDITDTKKLKITYA